MTVFPSIVAWARCRRSESAWWGDPHLAREVLHRRLPRDGVVAAFEGHPENAPLLAGETVPALPVLLALVEPEHPLDRETEAGGRTAIGRLPERRPIGRE